MLPPCPGQRPQSNCSNETHYAWQHELYRAYLKIDRDMFFGRGLNLAVMAAANLVLGQDDHQAQDRFTAAKAYLKAMSFDSGLTTVDAIRARALLGDSSSLPLTWC